MKEESSKPDSDEAVFDSALTAPVPQIYFNGFGIALGSADVTIVLNVAKKPTAVLMGSYEAWKTLASKILDGISEIEKTSGTTFRTMDQSAKKS